MRRFRRPQPSADKSSLTVEFRGSIFEPGSDEHVDQRLVVRMVRPPGAQSGRMGS